MHNPEYNPTPDSLFETAKRLRKAGNDINRALNPGMLGDLVAKADQRMFEAMVDAAQGIEREPDVAMCEEHDIPLDENGCCSECEA